VGPGVDGKPLTLEGRGTTYTAFATHYLPRTIGTQTRNGKVCHAESGKKKGSNRSWSLNA